MRRRRGARNGDRYRVRLVEQRTIALAVALAFAFGYAFTMFPLRRTGMRWAHVLRLAFAADTVSITIMEIVDNAMMLGDSRRDGGWSRVAAVLGRAGRLADRRRRRRLSGQSMDDRTGQGPRRGACAPFSLRLELGITKTSFPRMRESSVFSTQRRWVPAFAGTTTTKIRGTTTTKIRRDNDCKDPRERPSQGSAGTTTHGSAGKDCKRSPGMNLDAPAHGAPRILAEIPQR